MLDPVRRLLMRGWYRSLDAALAAVPYPEDAPVARAPGPDPVRVLLLGSGAASGWGVRTHELALTGHLARVLAGTVRRGVQVDARVDRTLRAAGLPDLVEDVAPGRYDAAVLVVGLNDAVNLTPLEDWRTAVGRLLDRVAEVVPAEAVLLLGPHPVQAVGTYRGRPAATAEQHRGPLNRAAAELAAERGTAFDVLPAPGRPVWASGHPSPTEYAEWAAWIAPRLAPLLPGCTRGDDGPQPESERQRAVEALLPDAPPDPRLDRITRLAREMFGTGMAAVSLLDGPVQRNRSVVGSDRKVLPRMWSMCDQAIRGEGALVIPDLSEDPRFRDSPAVTGEEHLRFYAGYPIESPDGYRVGALCVLDDRPRDPADIDTDALAELALLAQKELWRSAAG